MLLFLSGRQVDLFILHLLHVYEETIWFNLKDCTVCVFQAS